MFEQNDNEKNTPADYNAFYENGGKDPDSRCVNYDYDPQEPKKPNKAGRIALRCIAGAAALAIVSVSSIELYKIYGKSGERTWNDVPGDSIAMENIAPSEEEKVQETGSAPSDSSTSSASSWIQMAQRDDALSIPDIVDKNLPSVVGVSAVFEVEQKIAANNFWGFGFYSGGQGTTQTQEIPATGTGIVMSEDGYIITNAHCIYDSSSEYKAGKAVSVSVVMDNTSDVTYDAQIVGYDLETDLAVLKIDATGLVAAEFGESTDLRVGELVVAIGNPLGFDLFRTTTCGIVSALNREITINERKMTLIQTDAAINSGNSGGALLNSCGQVIGITSAKLSSTFGSNSASVEGLCFAIPISDAMGVISDLIQFGYVTGRPQIGITGVDVDAETAQRYSMPQGVYVYSVSEGGAAENAGIRQGDIITAVNGEEITDMDELNDIKNRFDAGDSIELTVFRSGQTMTVTLTLQEVKQAE